MILYFELPPFLQERVDYYRIRTKVRDRFKIVLRDLLDRTRPVFVGRDFFALYLTQPESLYELPGYNFRRLVEGGHTRAIWSVYRNRWHSTDAMLPEKYLFSSGRNRMDGYFGYF